MQTMNGYLMQEKNVVRGEDNFIESFSPENKHGVIFEDDGETGYFYAVEKDPEGQGLRILDALHIYEVDGQPADTQGLPADDANGNQAAASPSKLLIVWSKDWEKCALVIDGFCHAVYDFKAQGGHNINEFPPPNEIWTKGERRLTDELIRDLF
jgi:hypothetical protein